MTCLVDSWLLRWRIGPVSPGHDIHAYASALGIDQTRTTNTSTPRRKP